MINYTVQSSRATDSSVANTFKTDDTTTVVVNQSNKTLDSKTTDSVVYGIGNVLLIVLVGIVSIVLAGIALAGAINVLKFTFDIS